MELKVSTRSHSGNAVLAAAGEIDLYTAPRLQAELTKLIDDDRPDRVVVDLAGVEFCDSTGMNVLLTALRRAREGGSVLELAAPRPAVRKILQVTGLNTVFTVHDSLPAELAVAKPTG